MYKEKESTNEKQSTDEVGQEWLAMDRIATYILGEIPMTEQGNRYILVISDYFTK